MKRFLLGCFMSLFWQGPFALASSEICSPPVDPDLFSIVSFLGESETCTVQDLETIRESAQAFRSWLSRARLILEEHDQTNWPARLKSNVRLFRRHLDCLERLAPNVTITCRSDADRWCGETYGPARAWGYAHRENHRQQEFMAGTYAGPGAGTVVLCSDGLRTIDHRPALYTQMIRETVFHEISHLCFSQDETKMSPSHPGVNRDREWTENHRILFARLYDDWAMDKRFCLPIPTEFSPNFSCTLTSSIDPRAYWENPWELVERPPVPSAVRPTVISNTSPPARPSIRVEVPPPAPRTPSTSPPRARSRSNPRPRGGW